MARLARPAVLTRGPLLSEAVVAQVVHRQHEHLTAGSLGARHQCFADVPVVGRVKLIPDRLAACLVDLLDRHRGDGGVNLELTPRTRDPRSGQLVVGAGGQVAEVRGRQRRPCGSLQVEHVEDTFHGPRLSACLKAARPGWGQGQWAGRQELEKTTP